MDRNFVAKIMKISMPGSSFRLLLALSEGENYISELARMAGLDASRTLNVLKKLEDKGLVAHTRTIGKNKYYKLNPNFIEQNEESEESI